MTRRLAVPPHRSGLVGSCDGAGLLRYYLAEVPSARLRSGIAPAAASAPRRRHLLNLATVRRSMSDPFEAA